jgi:hypothetical protein
MQCASCGARTESLNTYYEIPASFKCLNFMLLISYKKMLYKIHSAYNHAFKYVK